MRKNKANFKGAYIMDMLLAYNTTEDSQSLRDFWVMIIASLTKCIVNNCSIFPKPTLPGFVADVKEAGAKGNFMSAWARRTIDQELFDHLARNWRNKEKYPLKLMDPPLPSYSHEVAKNWSKYAKYGTFARSDHASFWYPIEKNATFKSILLSDLGPWRRDMSFHYHRVGDDDRWLSEANLDFMKNTVDSLILTMLDLGQGKCFDKK